MGIFAQSLDKISHGFFGRRAETESVPSASNEENSRVSVILKSRKIKRIDVYHRPTFNRIVAVETSAGEKCECLDYFTDECIEFRTVGAKKEFAYRPYDFDLWMDDEMKSYDAKFAFKPINDEVADMMFFAVPGVKADAEELEGNFLEEEFDIAYEKLPDFLPDVIKEAQAEEEILEITELEVVEELAEPEPAEEQVEILNIEAPQVAGLLEEPVVEELSNEVPIAEKTTFSIGFGTVAAANVGETVFSFGFGVEEYEDEPEISTVSVVVDNAVYAATNNEEGHAVTL